MENIKKNVDYKRMNIHYKINFKSELRYTNNRAKVLYNSFFRLSFTDGAYLLEIKKSYDYRNMNQLDKIKPHF